MAEAARGDVIVLTDGEHEVTLTPRRATTDPDGDSPELEAELLKAVDGPFTAYSRDEMRAIGERIIREYRQG